MQLQYYYAHVSLYIVYGSLKYEKNSMLHHTAKIVFSPKSAHCDLITSTSYSVLLLFQNKRY